MIVLLSGFFAYYLTKIFLFEHKESHYGPWPSHNKIVKHIDHYGGLPAEVMVTYTQPVTLFDWVRRFFGLYEITTDDPIPEGNWDIKTDQEIWIVRERRIELWTCTTCLSFWSATIVSLLLLLIQRDLWMWPLNLGILAGISAFLHNIEAVLTPSSDVIIDRDTYDARQSQ